MRAVHSCKSWLCFHIRDIKTICTHFVQIQLWPSGQVEEQIRSFGATNKITKVRTLPCFFFFFFFEKCNKKVVHLENDGKGLVVLLFYVDGKHLRSYRDRQ